MHKAFRIFVITLAVLAVAACGLKIGDKMVVKVNYTGTLPDGSEFDSSKGRDPLEFMIGSGQMIPKFEQNLIGLRKGDKKTFTIVAADAYGERDEAMLIEVPLAAIPKDLKLEVGLRLLTTTPVGEQMEVRVAELRKDVAVIDYNHPLAGKDLTFAIEVNDVRKPTKDELSALQPPSEPVAQ